MGTDKGDLREEPGKSQEKMIAVSLWKLKKLFCCCCSHGQATNEYLKLILSIFHVVMLCSVTDNTAQYIWKKSPKFNLWSSK